MSPWPNRAPISYDELRVQYNMTRAIGVVFCIVGIVAYSLRDGSSTLLPLLIPAGVIAIDAVYRLRDGSNPFPGLLIDATVIVAAMYLRGPELTVYAVVLLALLVTSSVLLPFRQVLAIMAYAGFWFVTIELLNNSIKPPGLGFVAESGNAAMVDMLTVIAVVGVVAALLFQSVKVILAAQDRQEAALAVERRAVELKNEFVSMVSHELRTPLTGISGFTEMLTDSWNALPPEEIDEFLAIMHRETEHLANLVEDILVIPRLEAGHLKLAPEELDLTIEVHNVAEVVFDDTDYSVSIPTNVGVYADRTRIRQILRNLLENARKYGGDQVLIEGEMAGSGLYKVSVLDNGRGIAPEDRERIFEHFEQLSTGDGRLQQGVGLGLPIARKLAQAMGGDLWYEERFPMGSRFCFTVQMASNATDDATETPIPQVHA
ncbi:Osmosensitive K+ channel histidine kinase KdpD [hydrothermal vent metagenome]|uniref:histidine kinase n=1 Tax=hydrothermal vent metagenome TaxID=652676 RepID=A0A3B0RVK5_9ZZZZ